MSNDTAGQHQLLWYRRTGTDTDGWSERESEFFLPGRGDHGSVLLYLEFPGWCGIESWDWTVSVGDGEPLSYQVTSGYYSLRLPLCEGSETRIRFTASADFELSSNDRRRSYRVAGVALGPVCAEGLTQLQGIESVQLEKAPVGYEWVEAGVWEFVQRNLVYLSFSPIQEEPGCEKILWHGREVGRTGSIESLKGKFGEDCFIVASGPSVSDIDFSLLKDKTLFAVNGAIVLQQNENVQFDLYMATNEVFSLNRFNLLRQALLSGACCFLSRRSIAIICLLEPDLLENGEIYLARSIYNTGLTHRQLVADKEFVLESSLPETRPFGFSKNISKGVFGGRTVVFEALQVCYTLKLFQVFILGMDLSTTDDQVHFYEKESEIEYENIGDQINYFYKSGIERAFSLLNRLLNNPEERFHVVNLSMDSRLPSEIIPKSSLTTVSRTLKAQS